MRHGLAQSRDPTGVVHPEFYRCAVSFNTVGESAPAEWAVDPVDVRQRSFGIDPQAHHGIFKERASRFSDGDCVSKLDGELFNARQRRPPQTEQMIA